MKIRKGNTQGLLHYWIVSGEPLPLPEGTRWPSPMLYRWYSEHARDPGWYYTPEEYLDSFPLYSLNLREVDPT